MVCARFYALRNVVAATATHLKWNRAPREMTDLYNRTTITSACASNEKEMKMRYVAHRYITPLQPHRITLIEWSTSSQIPNQKKRNKNKKKRCWFDCNNCSTWIEWRGKNEIFRLIATVVIGVEAPLSHQLYLLDAFVSLYHLLIVSSLNFNAMCTHWFSNYFF